MTIFWKFKKSLDINEFDHYQNKIRRSNNFGIKYPIQFLIGVNLVLLNQLTLKWRLNLVHFYSYHDIVVQGSLYNESNFKQSLWLKAANIFAQEIETLPRWDWRLGHFGRKVGIRGKLYILRSLLYSKKSIGWG